MLQENSNKLQLEDGTRKKLNIFDQSDANALKNETLLRLGYTEGTSTAVQPYNDEQALHSSRSFSQASSVLGLEKPKAIEYLSKGREQKEAVKDFVLNSRKILISQICINDKNEETERLKEYIIMEKEKLEQAKKTFAEDSDKFNKYQEDLRNTTKEVQNQFEKSVEKKNEKVSEIKRIEGDIVAKELEIKKIEETV